MALTPKFSPVNEDATGKGVRYYPFGPYKYAVGKLTFTDGDVYATGGFGIGGAQVGTTGVSGTLSGLMSAGMGIRTIEHLEFTGVSTTSTGNLSGTLYAVWDYTNRVVKLFQIGRATDNSKPAPDTEVTNGALLTGVTLPFIVIGT